MLPFLLFACLSQLSQSQNAGIVFSRGYSDMAALIKKNTPGLFTSFQVTPNVTLTFTGRDFITQVTYTLSNLVLKDFIVQPSNLNVTFNPSIKSVGIKISNFTCNVYYNYTEIGFNINKTGSAITTFSASEMIVNIILFYENGHLNYFPDYQNFTVFIVDSATVSDTMSRSMISTANTVMRNYWNLPQNQEPIVKKMDVVVDEYINQLDYYYYISGTGIYMDGALDSNVIVIGDSYVSTQLNGSFAVNNTVISVNAEQPTVLPDRYNDARYSGMTQMMITNYTLSSYFPAIDAYYNTINITSLPAGYPNFLSTSNGYLPELLAKYGNTQLSISVKMNQPAMVFIMNRGILVRMSVKSQLMVKSGGYFQSEMNFTYVFDYMCTPLIKDMMVEGACYKPRSVKFNMVNSMTAVSSLGVKNFISSLIQYSFFAGDTNFYFPTVPLGYPAGTVINDYFVDYSQNYFIISYQPFIKI